MIYRIVTEDKGRDKAIATLVLKYFDSFSISKQVGYYKGVKEKSTVIEIDDFIHYTSPHIGALCRAIRNLLNQECVLLQTIESKSQLI